MHCIDVFFVMISKNHLTRWFCILKAVEKENKFLVELKIINMERISLFINSQETKSFFHFKIIVGRMFSRAIGNEK